ncbi:hypothetical protein BDY24DRAFT_13215 [Mrakia frigida]|uniref:uncharacterized protein n=1 Tax=Mrakia frigida TaxID=29902 RepID=UPI003FCC2237
MDRLPLDIGSNLLPPPLPPASPPPIASRSLSPSPAPPHLPPPPSPGPDLLHFLDIVPQSAEIASLSTQLMQAAQQQFDLEYPVQACVTLSSFVSAATLEELLSSPFVPTSVEDLETDDLLGDDNLVGLSLAWWSVLEDWQVEVQNRCAEEAEERRLGEEKERERKRLAALEEEKEQARPKMEREKKRKAVEAEKGKRKRAAQQDTAEMRVAI